MEGIRSASMVCCSEEEDEFHVCFSDPRAEEKMREDSGSGGRKMVAIIRMVEQQRSLYPLVGCRNANSFFRAPFLFGWLESRTKSEGEFSGFEMLFCNMTS